MVRLISANISLWLLVSGAFGQVARTLPGAVVPVFRKDTLNIVSTGAVPDGKKLNTVAINNAINRLSSKGGGVVLIPSGLWLTGPIVLKNNINLHLSTGAVLQFTSDLDQYALVATNWEGLPQMRNQSPISAVLAENIAITGKGIVDGNGDVWRMVKKDKLSESQWKKLVASGGVLSADGKTWYPSAKSKYGAGFQNPGLISSEKTKAFYDSIKDFLRPNLLVLDRCKKILLEGVTFQNSPAWCLHPLMSEDITVRGISVKNPWYAQNGDGIDVESCRNVVIENSVFDVGDDALCMKSGRDVEGRKRGMPTQNVLIRNCTVYAAHGGFVIGSEMSGGVKNVHVFNCSFIGTDIGLRFKTTRGRGGTVEDIFIQDIRMKDIPGEAILFDMYYAARDPVPLAGENRALPVSEFKTVDASTPVFRNFKIKNVYCNGAAQAIYFRGLPEKHVQDMVLEDMVFQSKKGIYIEEASGISFRNIRIESQERNPLVDIIQSDNIGFDGLSFDGKVELLFRVSGDRSKQINFKKTDTTSAQKTIAFELGASEKSMSQ